MKLILDTIKRSLNILEGCRQNVVSHFALCAIYFTAVGTHNSPKAYGDVELISKLPLSGLQNHSTHSGKEEGFIPQYKDLDASCSVLSSPTTYS
jgi:hypothetical protein